MQSNIQDIQANEQTTLQTNAEWHTSFDFVCQRADCGQIVKKVNEVIIHANLPLKPNWIMLDKTNNKNLKQIASNHNISNPFLMVEQDKKYQLICYLCTIENDEKGKPNIIKVSLDWHKLQRRIVTAGRKSELLLQACKLTADSKVIDATAGFGHDSLIMASGGAKLVMLEQNPLMLLLLILEKERMSQEKNWQGLMARLDIKYVNAVKFLQGLQEKTAALNFVERTEMQIADVIYLDPMFPQASYQGAKVGKGMQILHDLALPPTAEQQKLLLTMARQAVTKNGRVVVKRPKNAPFFANVPADESWENDVVRFDGYFYQG